MVGQRPSLPVSLDSLQRHQFQRTQARVAGIVDQHRDIFVVLLSNIEDFCDVLSNICVGVLSPGDAPYYIGPQLHRFTYEAGCTRLSNNSVLSKGYHLDIDDALKLFSSTEDCFDTLQSGFGVYISESSDVRVTE